MTSTLSPAFMELARPVLQTRPLPLPGQTLQSYLEHLCVSLPLKLPLVTVLYLTGLIDAELVKALQPGHGVVLDDARCREFARLTRLPETAVRAMLLSHYDGVALDLSGIRTGDADSIRLAALTSWASFTSTWVCPLCIAETGALQVSWRLPLHFACMRHQVLHVNTCPGCGKAIGSYRLGAEGRPGMLSHVPHPGHCSNPPETGNCSPGGSARPCGYDLSRIPATDLSAHPRLLETQRRLLDVLDRREGRVAGTTRPALTWVQHLRSLCALLLYCARPGDLGALPAVASDAIAAHVEDRDARLVERAIRRETDRRGGPSIIAYRGGKRSPALMSAVLPSALEILDCDNVIQLADRIAPFMTRAQEHRPKQIRMLGDNFNFTGVLADAFDLLLSARADYNHRLGARSRYSREPYRFTPEHVPPLLWQSTYDAQFKRMFKNADIGDSYARRGISMALVKLVVDCSWVEAARFLELDPKNGSGSAHKVIAIINAGQLSDDFGEALHSVAARLSADYPLVNYAALRRRMSTYTEVPWHQWISMVERSGRTTGTLNGRHRLAGAYVWATATESDWRLSPALSDGNTCSNRELFRRFSVEELPFLRSELDNIAKQLADDEHRRQGQ